MMFVKKSWVQEEVKRVKLIFTTKQAIKDVLRKWGQNDQPPITSFQLQNASTHEKTFIL